MDYAVLRNIMVKEQIAARGIKEQGVLSAFLKVERHRFIPEISRGSSYADHPVPIGEGQTISQPYIVALMTECLDLSGNEKILEIGSGSGYQTAILAELAKEVYSVERIPSLAERAKAVLAELGYNNIKIKVDDGTLGWQEEAPFDRIIVTAASHRIPPPLIEQLKEGGRLLIPLGESFSQVLTVAQKQGGTITTSNICGCVFVPLIGKYAQKEDY